MVFRPDSLPIKANNSLLTGAIKAREELFLKTLQRHLSHSLTIPRERKRYGNWENVAVGGRNREGWRLCGGGRRFRHTAREPWRRH